jgi:glycolate oxidase FAD binding subunit
VIPAPALRTLREALGPGCVREDEGARVDGEPLAPTLRPADAEALAAALRTLGQLSLACVIRGGGSRLDLGNPPRGASLLLSTALLTGVDEFDASEGVCHAGAGTPLAEIEKLAATSGWQLPLDPPGAGSTLGGTLASAAFGPRAQGFGRPRDCVLGLEVALADGSRTHCGGRVVKNVTGYDLNKLYTGSLGTLGVIEAAWLRLRPRPARVTLLEIAPDRLAVACAGALAAARRPSARAASLHSAERRPGERPFGVVVELAGDEASVERDAAWCASELGATPAPADALARVRERQGSTPGEGGLRFRIAGVPSRSQATLAELWDAGAELLAYPGLGLVYAGFALAGPEDPAAADAAFRCIDAVAEAGAGAALLESAPTWAKQGRDVFGDLAGLLPLTRDLKRRFDPAGLLNPGRFAGHL